MLLVEWLQRRSLQRMQALLLWLVWLLAWLNLLLLLLHGTIQTPWPCMLLSLLLPAV